MQLFSLESIELGFGYDIIRLRNTALCIAAPKDTYSVFAVHAGVKVEFFLL